MNCKVYFYQINKFSNCRYKKVLPNSQNHRSWDEVQDFHPKVVFSSFKSLWWTWCIVYKSKLNGFRSILRLIENENTCTLQKSLKENENTRARNPSKRAFSSLKSHWVTCYTLSMSKFNPFRYNSSLNNNVHLYTSNMITYLWDLILCKCKNKGVNDIKILLALGMF